MYARTVFGCGIDKQLFQDRHETLDEKEQQRLERVARRVWITLKLRYETFTFSDPFQTPEERYYLEMVEMPAIEIYLLVSCLDTLAGQPIHVPFKEWLKKKVKVKSLSYEEIIALHDEYMNEHGSNRNLRKLFKSFPQSFKTWLTTNIVIYEDNKSLNEADRDPELLVERLLSYFYGLRRNEFTHSSYARQVSKSVDIELPEVNGRWFAPASGTLITLDRHKKNKRWYFSYREGLDEATILRLIIHIVVLQIAGIEVTEGLINLNLNNYSRIHTLYFFMSEVVNNSDTLERWQNLEQLSKADWPYSMIFSGIQPLRKQFSHKMIDRYKPEIEWESSFQAMTRQYAMEVDQLNAMIDDFNTQNPPIGPKQGNLEERWTIIKDFLQSLTRSSAYKKMLHWPSKPEMTNLWLIIRDPCHIS